MARRSAQEGAEGGAIPLPPPHHSRVPRPWSALQAELQARNMQLQQQQSKLKEKQRQAQQLPDFIGAMARGKKRSRGSADGADGAHREPILRLS